jgi:hypothetical protein
MSVRARRLAPLAAILLLAAAASAQQSWVFDQTTTGQAIHWVSPTAVSTTSAGYDTSYQLELVEVKLKYLGFIPLGPFDVTNQIPPEVQSGSGNFAGPAPVQLFGAQVAYPEPPAAPSLAADIGLGLDATGHGYFDASNLTLGSITMDVPNFGTITAQITSVRLKGSLTITPTQWLQHGNALAGALGDPALVGAGSLVAGEPMSVTLSNAVPDAPFTLIAGFSQLDAAFKGGFLVPSPDVIVAGLGTGPGGGLSLGTSWPAGVPSGLQIWIQAWIVDAAGPKGLAASNGISGTAP